MIAVDTNILVHAHREDAILHEEARRCLAALAEGRSPWAIPWPCVHEFIAIVTHRKVFAPPTPLASALAQIALWMESPKLVLLAESPDYWALLTEVATGGRATGPLIHDARIAALCRTHGVRELWTADRDFGRFPGLIIRNPLTPKAVGEHTVRYVPRRAKSRLRRTSRA